MFVTFFGAAFVLVAADVPVHGTLAALTRWGHGDDGVDTPTRVGATLQTAAVVTLSPSVDGRW